MSNKVFDLKETQNMMPTYESLHINDLTPVEVHDGIFYKRDDKYMPFDDVPLSGGKVRQACSLLLENYEHIRDDCDGLVATASALSSPQGIIIARVAKEFGFRSLILFGGTHKKSVLKKHPLTLYITNFGARVNLTAKLGYDDVVQSYLKKLIKEGLKCFNVRFGINLSSSPKSIIEAIGRQVQNIPDDLDMLIIPCGSCITACGIMWGLQEYNKVPKKIYLIQISNKFREKEISEASNALKIQFPEYTYIKDATYPYNKKVRLPFGGGYMDPIYEGKAFDYMNKHIDTKGKKVLFWIVGDSQPVRDHAEEFRRRLKREYNI